MVLELCTIISNRLLIIEIDLDGKKIGKWDERYLKTAIQSILNQNRHFPTRVLQKVRPNLWSNFKFPAEILRLCHSQGSQTIYSKIIEKFSLPTTEFWLVVHQCFLKLFFAHFISICTIEITIFYKNLHCLVP